MSSQKSTKAIAPKRQRGHDRVAAIRDAATELFAEKGYDGTTMTAIAERSNTAIGSLYRFFPTKEALAEVLLDSYWARIFDRIADLAEHAEAYTPDRLAQALVDMMLEHRQHRAAAVALLDANGDPTGRRQALRQRMIRELAALMRASGAADATRARVAAPVLLQLLKGVRMLADEPRHARAAIAEMRAVIAQYLTR